MHRYSFYFIAKNIDMLSKMIIQNNSKTVWWLSPYFGNSSYMPDLQWKENIEAISQCYKIHTWYKSLL